MPLLLSADPSQIFVRFPTTMGLGRPDRTTVRKIFILITANFPNLPGTYCTWVINKRTDRSFLGFESVCQL